MLKTFASQVEKSLVEINSADEKDATVILADSDIPDDWVYTMFGVKELDENDRQESFANLIRDIFDKKKVVYDVKSGIMRCANGKKYMAGLFYAPSLKEILDQLQKEKVPMGRSTIVHITNKDASFYIHNDLGDCEMMQAASQCNGLEMINPNVTPNKGIGVYRNDRTQGPAVAMAAAAGTFIRNYWLTRKLMGQFNSLYDYELSHINGYLLWGTSPNDAYSQLANENHEFDIRVPYMLYTQSVGYHSKKYLADFQYHEDMKIIHQAYTSSAPVNYYRNGGDNSTQYGNVFYLLVAEYRSLIAMSLLLWSIDSKLGLNKNENPTVDINLIGTGVFKNPVRLVTAAIRTAMLMFKQYRVDYRIHAFPNTLSDVRATLDETESVDFDRFGPAILADCAQSGVGGYLVDRLRGEYGQASSSSSSAYGYGINPALNPHQARMAAQQQQREREEEERHQRRLAEQEAERIRQQQLAARLEAERIDASMPSRQGGPPFGNPSAVVARMAQPSGEYPVNVSGSSRLPPPSIRPASPVGRRRGFVAEQQPPPLPSQPPPSLKRSVCLMPK